MVLSIGFTGTLMACNPEDTEPQTETPTIPGNNNENNTGNSHEMNRNMQIEVQIDSIRYTLTLTDNTTAEAFLNMLPMTVYMSELNKNEKYHYLPVKLPTAEILPGTIRAGDLMLYGNNCLVLFYKTFSTSYSYTRIGTMEDASGLESALGTGNVTVTFQIPEESTEPE